MGWKLTLAILLIVFAIIAGSLTLLQWRTPSASEVTQDKDSSNHLIRIVLSDISSLEKIENARNAIVVAKAPWSLHYAHTKKFFETVSVDKKDVTPNANMDVFVSVSEELYEQFVDYLRRAGVTEAEYDWACRERGAIVVFSQDSIEVFDTKNPENYWAAESYLSKYRNNYSEYSSSNKK